ncbi:ROK family protein [Autumnicola musiva]|uniref:ROK family protein n=1 Tax=Autumnicola musiva TaxID=3075589 RepID=A0ABU3D8M7_9FLAO|nr:ROK family protein [Zunongwangia sp. F117]MDT0677880.1 ROK family protein [Zunongwangia sp. F117]
MYSIGVDIGGSHISACLYNHNKKEVNKESLIYRKIDSKGSKKEIIHGWVDALETCRQTTEEEVVGIGIAMPGPFDYYNGISLIKDVDKLTALYKINIRVELSEKLGIQPLNIRFINDATAFSIAEAMVGCAAQYKRVVAVTLGTGLGSSFLIDGKPIILDKRVPEGGFLYNQFYHNEMADDVFSTRGILNRYKSLSGNNIPNVRAICDRVEEDDSAKKSLLQFGGELGDFLKPYLHEFDAEVLVLGGNIAKAFPYFGKALSAYLPDIPVKVSNLGEQAAITGSALLVDNGYYNTIKSTLKLM